MRLLGFYSLYDQSELNGRDRIAWTISIKCEKIKIAYWVMIHARYGLIALASVHAAFDIASIFKQLLAIYKPINRFFLHIR